MSLPRAAEATGLIGTGRSCILVVSAASWWRGVCLPFKAAKCADNACPSQAGREAQTGCKWRPCLPASLHGPHPPRGSAWQCHGLAGVNGCPCARIVAALWASSLRQPALPSTHEVLPASLVSLQAGMKDRQGTPLRATLMHPIHGGACGGALLRAAGRCGRQRPRAQASGQMPHA